MAKQPKPLTGQVAAITGAARGIGRATAEAFIRQGMKVAIGDLDLAEAQRTADQLGAGTIAVELNVTDKASIARFLDETEAQLGPVDVLARYGGEEFGVLLPSCDITRAQEVLDRVRGATPNGQSASAGVVSYDGRESRDSLLARADAALYRAKHAGRSTTVTV